MRAAVLAPLLALLGGLLVAAPASAVTVTITSNLTKVREGSPVEFSGKAPAGSTVQLYQGAHKIPTPSTTASTKVPLPAATTKATSSGTWKITIVSAERAADGKKYVDGFRNYRVRVGSTQSAARQVNSYRPVSVSLSKTISGKKTAVATNEEIYSRSGITFSAVLSYGVKGNPAYLQRRVPTRSSSGKITGTQWATVKTATTGSTGANRTVSFGSVSTPPGRWQYRVSTKLVGLYAIGYSTTPAVHVVSCTTYPSRPAGIQPAFSNPGAYSTADRTKRSKALRDQLVKTICAADTGAELKLAMWHIDDDGLYKNPPEMVNPILRALDYVSATRKVKVSMVVNDTTGKQAYTTEWLKQIAARNGGGYYECKEACMSDRGLSGQNNAGDNHQKLLTISKAKGAPVTVISTSNWSYWQLRDYWNSSSVLWNDANIYARSSARLSQMIQAAERTSAGNGGWATSGADGLVKSADDNTWAPADVSSGDGMVSAKERKGSGSGAARTAVSFSPSGGYDPILDRLKGSSYTCDKGEAVRFAVLLGTGDIGTKWVDTIKELKAKGCKVYVVMSRPIPSGSHVFGTDKATFDGLKKQLGGSTTYLRCGQYIHTKNILSDEKSSVWTGPRNLDYSGFRLSDETTLRVWNDPTLYNRYKTDWINIWKKSTSCGSTHAAFMKLR
ncbi:phospholipase D-like domain-containing protein [Aeromicrobium sp. Leaf245]|uniref:phospholipase D-like domain-containing protein n=1 Tax=Aeromicrobium sp. Leaf245 TaxID=1736306 RepID=UPI0006F991D5|nr:phospholipase D-like domain-containing protein [Aeromicrobium sp. Leaf245]KQO42010.1 hypothetical protein ASF05_13090 [Aeromicrobium sp. Leaf245]